MSENSPKWNDEFLKSMSIKTDPFAENLMKEIAEEGGFNQLRELFASLNNNNKTVSGTEINSIIANYFNTNMDLPSWAEAKKIKLAQEVYTRYCPQVALILNFNALPICYTCKNGAKVLVATGRLTGKNEDVSRTFRRLFETSSIVMDVMSPGGLSPEGNGIVTAKKVRLYHAAIRYFLLNEKYNPKGWDIENLGAPINQEEMAGTLMAFSALVLEGLEQLGAILTNEEKDAYMHCWLIAGHFLGLEPELFPKNFKEGFELGISIIKRNNQESEESKILTIALLDFSTHLFRKTAFERIILTNIPYYLIGFFVDNISNKIDVNLTNVLGIDKKLSPYSRFKGKVFISTIRLVTKLEGRNRLFRILYSKVSLKFLKRITEFYLKKYNAEFYIPSSLKESWNMK